MAAARKSWSTWLCLCSRRACKRWRPLPQVRMRQPRPPRRKRLNWQNPHRARFHSRRRRDLSRPLCRANQPRDRPKRASQRPPRPCRSKSHPRLRKRPLGQIRRAQPQRWSRPRRNRWRLRLRIFKSQANRKKTDFHSFDCRLRDKGASPSHNCIIRRKRRPGVPGPTRVPSFVT
jgi:hypothetical protein